jgi:hypothetical protein
MPYYVYIVYTQGSDIYYKGFTTDPKKRLDEHNAGLSRYTSHDGPWIIVYLEEFQSKTEALILAVGYWLLAFGIWLLAVSFWLLAVGRLPTLDFKAITLPKGCLWQKLQSL